MTTLYCTNEDLAVRLPGDFVALCPAWQYHAKAADGVVSGWTLASASVTFDTGVVKTGQVVLLEKGPYKGSGELLAVDAATSNLVTLRRIGAASGTGQAPAAGTSVTYRVPHFDPQIADATYELKQRFGIDDAVTLRSADRVYDLRVLRQLTVLTVLQRQLATMVRDDTGDWALKLRQVAADYGDLLARTDLRWGARGNDQPSVNRFGTRLSR